MSHLISDVYETIAVDSFQSEVLECYKLSKYVVDPNKARFKKVVRNFAFALRFTRKLQKKSKICQPSTAQKTSYPGILSDEEITASENYFFKKETSEVKEIAKKYEYQKISFQKAGILYYKVRILATENINTTCEMSTVMKYLSSDASSVQYSKGNPLPFRCSKTLKCRNCMEICFETWIHNVG